MSIIAQIAGELLSRSGCTRVPDTPGRRSLCLPNRSIVPLGYDIFVNLEACLAARCRMVNIDGGMSFAVHLDNDSVKRLMASSTATMLLLVSLALSSRMSRRDLKKVLSSGRRISFDARICRMRSGAKAGCDRRACGGFLESHKDSTYRKEIVWNGGVYVYISCAYLIYTRRFNTSTTLQRIIARQSLLPYSSCHKFLHLDSLVTAIYLSSTSVHFLNLFSTL